MKINKLVAAISLIAASHSVFAAGGISLGATRVVYNANNKEASLTVNNKNTEQYFLIQSWVDDKNGNKKVPFAITPPLFRLNAKNENMLRIVKTAGEVPSDRESVYWVNVKSIPPMPAENGPQNVLQLAITTRIKMFYRPSGLVGKAEDAPAQLQWVHQGNELIVKNPSAYSVSLGEVKIAGKDIPGVNLVLPKDEAHYTLPAGSGGIGNVTYRAITDFGGLTNPITSEIH
ncbi:MULTISPECIES: molecular chaperone [Hafnia]|uniref:fimbrial biogenesis chaperone n=1 Tax=Hafnia TaxID=568 RepID=UPI0006219FF1|nr:MULTISPECIES: fimbria/pilus periplasmic chaperone [Hafnia]KKI41844.1 long polar fimbrial chaperone LpfB [Hafnia alvei]